MRYIFIVTIFMSLVSCGPEVVYERSYDVGTDWSYDETMDFDIDIKDTTQEYNLEFLLDHSDDYTFQNIYVNITTTYPDGTNIADEVSLQLANNRGEFVGKCSGGDCTVTIVLQEKFKFKQLGKHTISIAQHSRRSVLDGISNGELRLVKYEGT